MYMLKKRCSLHCPPTHLFRSCWFIILLFLVSCGSDQTTFPMFPGDTGNGEETGTGDAVKAIDIELTSSGIIFAPVSINGGPTAYLVLDTGAPTTLLDGRLIPGEPFQYYATARLEIGDTVIENAEVVPLNFGECSPCETDAPFDGILGMSALEKFDVTIDYKGAKLYLAKRGSGGVSPPDGETGSSVDVSFEFLGYSRIIVRPRVEGQTAWALVDTGASLFSVTDSLFSRLPQLDRPFFIDRAQVADCSLIPIHITRFAELAMSEGAPVFDLPGDNIFYWDTLESIAEETGRDLEILVGGTYLRNFFVTFNFSKKTMSLAPYFDPDIDPYEFVGPSLIFRQENCDLLVEEVFAGGDAEAASVMEGDRLTEVDGVAVDEIYYDPLHGQEPGKKVLLTFERQGAPFDALLTLYDRLPPLGQTVNSAKLRRRPAIWSEKPGRVPRSPWPAGFFR